MRVSIASIAASFAAVSLAGALGCAGRPLPDKQPFSVAPVQFDRGQWREVDQVFVVTDASGTMYMEKTFPEAKALSQSFISSMPEPSARAKSSTYQASAIAFGGDDRMVAPLSSFSRSSLQAKAREFQVMGSIDGRGGLTPYHALFREIGQDLEGKTGRAAVVMFSDGLADDPDYAVAGAEKLAQSYGGGICFHGVQVGDDPEGAAFFQRLAAVNGCGSVSSATQVASASGMSSFTRDVLSGKAPAPAPAPPPPRADTCGVLRLRGVNFAFDSAQIGPDSAVLLDAAAEELRRCGSKRISVNGHTDSTGPEAYNQGLSERRAASVRQHLSGAGIGAGRMQTRGFGESKPIASNDTSEGRALNRRVELVPVD